MGYFVLSHQAKVDLHAIWQYIADDNLHAANRWTESFNERCANLAKHPFMGAERNDLAARLRYFPLGSYVILYRAVENGVEIIRVLHGARRLEALLRSYDKSE